LNPPQDHEDFPEIPAELRNYHGYSLYDYNLAPVGSVLSSQHPLACFKLAIAPFTDTYFALADGGVTVLQAMATLVSQNIKGLSIVIRVPSDNLYEPTEYHFKSPSTGKAHTSLYFEEGRNGFHWWSGPASSEKFTRITDAPPLLLDIPGYSDPKLTNAFNSFCTDPA